MEASTRDARREIHVNCKNNNIFQEKVNKFALIHEHDEANFTGSDFFAVHGPGTISMTINASLFVDFATILQSVSAIIQLYRAICLQLL